MIQAASQRRKAPKRSLAWKLDSRHKLQLGGLVAQTGLRDAIGLEGDLELDAGQADNVRIFRGVCCLLVGALSGDAAPPMREKFLTLGAAFEEDWRRGLRPPRRARKRRPPNEENRHKIQLGGLMIQAGLRDAMGLEGDLEKDPAQAATVRLLRGALCFARLRLADENNAGFAQDFLRRGAAFEAWLAGGAGQGTNPYAFAASDAA
jgi:hypothetical protein